MQAPSHITLNIVLDAQRKLNPYIYAHVRYVSGDLLVSQAALMVACDRDFVAECERTGRDAKGYALAIVRDVWTPELVRNMQARKRAA